MSWYKHNPKDWLDGTRQLNPEQRGIYQTLLDLMYLTNGPLPLDWRRLAMVHCNCDVRVLKRVVGELSAQLKIRVTPDGLSNDRAMAEIAARKHRTAQNRELGRIGGLKSAAIMNENRHIGRAIGQANGVAVARQISKKDNSFFGSTSERRQAPPSTLEPSPELVGTVARKNGNGSHPPSTAAAPAGLVYVARSDPQFENITSAYRVVYGQEPKSDAGGAYFPHDVIVEPNSPTA